MFTPSRRFGSLLLLLLVALAGCGDPASVAPIATDTAPATTTPPETVASPDFNRLTTLALVSGDRTLKVGDSTDQAESFFERPRRSFLLRELPEAFGPGYRARGWESDRQGFGIVSYRDRVAAAMLTVEGVDETVVQETLQTHRRNDDPNNPDRRTFTQESRVARYWFWEEANQRVMVCAAKTYRGDFTVTVAVGDIAALDALRMSPEEARNDANRAERAATGS